MNTQEIARRIGKQNKDVMRDVRKFVHINYYKAVNSMGGRPLYYEVDDKGLLMLRYYSKISGSKNLVEIVDELRDEVAVLKSKIAEKDKLIEVYSSTIRNYQEK